MKLLILLVFLSPVLIATPLDSIKQLAEAYGYNEKLLYSIIEHESNFNPYAISITVPKRDVNSQSEITALLRRNKVEFYERSSEGYVYFSTYSKVLKTAKTIIILAQKHNLVHDIGLMQVTSGNIRRNRWDTDRLLSDSEYNIRAGMKVLESCYIKYGNYGSRDVIECYHHGFRPNRFTGGYYSQIEKIYGQ